MKNKFRKICRFCLETADRNLEIIEEVTFANLDFLWLKLNLSISEEPVMCGDCAKTIGNCSDFKTKCLEMENCIVSSVKDKDSIKIDLQEVYLRKISVEDIVNVPKDNMVCRLCLELVRNDSAALLRDSADIVTKLEQYFPELDLACTEDPVICNPCQVSLQQYFSFTNTCLTSEEKITEYSKVEGTNSMGQIDLNSVTHFISKDFVKCKLEVDTLKIEEKGNDDSENASNDVEIKKEEILDMELDIIEDNPEQESELTDDNSFQRHPSPTQSECVPRLTRTKSAKYTCEICGYQNNRRGRLQEHILAHKGIVQEFNCEMCPFKTTTKSSLKQHMITHKDASEVTMYKCDLCPYKTKHKKCLRKHTLVHKDKSEITIYKCELCDYETKRKNDLKRHMQTHKTNLELSMFSCNHCCFGTIYKENLTKHMVLHTDASKIKMYKCDLCPYESKWRSNFRKHQIYHENTSPTVGKPGTIYKCDQCEFETKWKKSLKGHALIHQTHSEITMYKCYHCEYKSKWKSGLREHMLVHQTPTKITMFKCDRCDYKTKRKGDLKRHMLLHKT